MDSSALKANERDDCGEIDLDAEFDRFLRPAEKSVTVKFTTDDETVFTQPFPASTTIADVKLFLVDVFALTGPDVIVLTHNDTPLTGEEHDVRVVNDFVSVAYERLDLRLTAADSTVAISAAQAYEEFANPDIISVRVETPGGTQRDVVVEIVDRSIEKPCLGGYASTATGSEYHNAYSQTGPPKPRVPPEMKATRDTQTYFYRNRISNTTYSHATQMASDAVWIPTVNDRILRSGPYETADEREKRLNVDGKVRTIQRYYRAWKMRKALKLLSAEYRARVQFERDRAAADADEDADRRRQELVAKVFPRTRADFSALYAMIDRWKRAEIDRIRSIACGASKIAQFYALLDKEIDMLRAIDRQRVALQRDARVRNEIAFLDRIGAPIFWHSDYKRIPIAMDTLETQRGRVFASMFARLCESRTSFERIHALIELKSFYAGHGCPLWHELTRLIDRSCTLIARGFHRRHTDVLDKRIEALTLRHFKRAECNDGVTARMTRVAEKRMTGGNLFYCPRCERFATSDRLMDAKGRSTLCVSCALYDRTVEPSIDLAPYRYMLRCIRRDERRMKSCSSVAYIVQDVDVYKIVMEVWHARSAISEAADVYELTLCRWFRDVDWSPWNCVLLTRQEAADHLKIKRLADVYDPEFFAFVRNKHAVAKVLFRVAERMDERFQEFGTIDTKWNEIADVTEFVAVNSKPKIFLSCH